MRLPPQLGLIYFLSELVLTLTHRSRNSGGVEQDRSTLRVLWLVIIGSITASIFAAARWPFAALPHQNLLLGMGIFLFVPGLILRWWAIIVLGRFFTVNVTIAQDHQLVEAGPYRLIRHPSYTGALLAFLGLALSLANWVAMLILVVPIFSAFIRRMNVEEDALLAGLGQPYAEYMARTKRLVPFIY